jgi:hypothetical protein
VTDPAQMPVREARPPEPKTATVERREASVPRHGTQGASLGAWPAASCAGRTGAAAPERFSALRPPSIRLAKQRCKTRAQKMRRGNERGCLKSE